MKNATVSKLKNHLSKFLRWVKQGEPVLILDRGIPVAEIHPRRQKTETASDRLNVLEAKGVIFDKNLSLAARRESFDVLP